MCCFYCHQNNAEKMGSLPILFIIHTIAIGTVLSFHDGSNGHGRKTLCVNRPSISAVFADGTAVTKKKLHMESVHFFSIFCSFIIFSLFVLVFTEHKNFEVDIYKNILNSFAGYGHFFQLVFHYGISLEQWIQGNGSLRRVLEINLKLERNWTKLQDTKYSTTHCRRLDETGKKFRRAIKNFQYILISEMLCGFSTTSDCLYHLYFFPDSRCTRYQSRIVISFYYIGTENR